MYNLEHNKFNTLLTEYRKSRGLTLECLGNQIGKSKATVSKYEHGVIIPDIITILEICNILNISLSQLFPMDNYNFKYNSKNPFLTDKLYLYYYTENILITSIVELKEENNQILANLFNGVKNTTTYAAEPAYYYEGKLVCDKTIGYIDLYNTTSQNTQLEKLQISFTIPWSSSIKVSNFFILGLTPNSIPTVKKGILATTPINNFDLFKDNLKITKYEFSKMQKDNAWILENKNYSYYL